MPYQNLDDLPDGVRNSLPRHGQEIYRSAFNGAWQTYSDRSGDDREETAHRVAWSAVKKQYERSGGGHWHKK